MFFCNQTFWRPDVLETWHFVNLTFCKPDFCKADVSDVLKPDVLQPDVLNLTLCGCTIDTVYSMYSILYFCFNRWVWQTNFFQSHIYKQYRYYFFTTNILWVLNTFLTFYTPFYKKTPETSKIGFWESISSHFQRNIPLFA